MPDGWVRAPCHVLEGSAISDTALAAGRLLVVADRRCFSPCACVNGPHFRVLLGYLSLDSRQQADQDFRGHAADPTLLH